MRGFGNHLCVLACAIALAGSASAAAEESVINLTVIADPVKANGSPWDGYPAVGGKIIVPETSNAPDIAVCLVQATGGPDCIWRTERRRTTSHCPDSTTCTIPGIRLPSLPIGLVFIDVDLVRHDLIDFVILTDKQASEDDVAKIDANLHAVMGQADAEPGAARPGPAEAESAGTADGAVHRREPEVRSHPVALLAGAAVTSRTAPST